MSHFQRTRLPALAFTLGIAWQSVCLGYAESPTPSAVVEGNNKFAIELYGKVKEGTGNRFISPYSASSALAMAYAGARGETAKEMASTLHFPQDSNQVHREFQSLIASIRSEAPGGGRNRARSYQLSTANALWCQQGRPIQQDYLRLTRTHYGAGIYGVDFQGSPDSAASTINAWIEKQTQGKIRNMLNAAAFEPKPALVLTNAVYFKGEWAQAFQEAGVAKGETFHAPEGKKAKADLMRRTSEYRYFADDSMQLLELPYKSGELSMLVMLPRSVDGLAGLESSLSADKLSGWIKSLRPTDVDVSLPKFKLTEMVELQQPLAALGISQAFSKEADFSGIGAELYLSKVIQKAFVEVNEKGTEAAAATAILAAPAAEGGGGGSGPVVFRADHPFVFLIRDNKTESILFMGRLVDPS